IYDLSFLSHIPNMTIMAPKNRHEFADMLEYAVMKHRGPIAVRYPRGAVYTGLSENNKPIELAKSETIKEGRDIAIVFVGAMAQTAENVCKRLEDKGYGPALINGRFIKPVDEDMVRSFAGYKHIFTIEDNIICGGFGSMVLEKAAELGVCLRSVHNIGFDDCFVEQGSREQLFEKYGLDAESIEKRILKIIKNEKKN
ncbi:MAG: 1-deoxy-D-xylulose-5-phosphate synthase, partial [Firmicutes bacterium]|nr:1-deoxy-D-xylulose-5-phosphate synthase [Bacillota bacterium]